VCSAQFLIDNSATMPYRRAALLIAAARINGFHHTPSFRPPKLRAASIGECDVTLPDETRDLVNAGAAPVDAAYAYELRFDGGCRGNPGPAGLGAVLYKDGATVWAGWCDVPDPATTNNVAEYSAFLFGCEALRRFKVDRVSILGDSKLVISQVKGDWQCREKHLIALRDRVRAALEGVDWTARNVPRAQNAVADALANHAMDSHTSGSCAPSSPSAPPPAAAGDRAAEKAAALAVVASLRALADAEERRIEEEYT
jgi:ribonuclease HI